MGKIYYVYRPEMKHVYRLSEVYFSKVDEIAETYPHNIYFEADLDEEVL